MNPDWERLRRRTWHAELSFLHSEVATGLTFARIALNASDDDKMSRNAQNARTAYQTAMSYLSGFPAGTPELADIQASMSTLRQMLNALEKRH